MIDQERVTSEPLHRFEKEMFKLEVLDAESLQKHSLVSSNEEVTSKELVRTSRRVRSDRSESLRSARVRAAFA